MTIPTPKQGSLVQRKGSPFWYLRYRRNGRQVMKSTKCKVHADAVIAANQMFKLEEGLIESQWEQHVRESLADSRSWIRELMRKVRSRNRGGSLISPADIERIALRSEGRCELTGVPFSLDNRTGSRTPPFKPSLDRIDCSQGYSYTNCRLITVAANIALRDWGDEVFREMCLTFTSKYLAEKAGGACAKSDAPSYSNVVPLSIVNG